MSGQRAAQPESVERRIRLQWSEMKFDIEKDKLVVLLVITDAVFVFLHLLHKSTNLLPSGLFSIEYDGGYGELFQYIKELWIIVLLVFIGTKQWKFIYFSLSLLFLYFLLDDSLRIHESAGAFLADSFNFHPQLGLRAIDFGELVVSVLVGAPLFALIGIAYNRSDVAARMIAKCIMAMVVLLALFGVLTDMVAIMVKHPVAQPILNIIEDAGEMFMMSVIAWFVFRLDHASGSDIISAEANASVIVAGQREIDEHERT